MKKRYAICLIACAMITAVMSGCEKKQQGAEPERQQETESQEVGEDAESTSHLDGTEESMDDLGFEGKDIEGNSVTESILSESRLTMINVWATYCNPCLSEMPGLGELAGEYDPEDFQIIGIVSDVMETDETGIEYAAGLIGQTGADYTHLLLNQSVYDAFLKGVSAVPTTYFLDEDGVVLDTVVGAMKKSAWEEKINALLER